MDAPIITAGRERELVAALREAASERSQAAALADQHKQGLIEAARSEYDRERERLTREFEDRHAHLMTEYKAARDALFSEYESQASRLASDEARLVREENQRHEELRDAARNLRQHRYQEVQKWFKEEQQKPRIEYAQFQQQCEYSASELSALAVKAQGIVRKRCPWPEESGPAPVMTSGLSRQEYLTQYSGGLGSAYQKAHELQQLPTARFLEEGWLLLIFLALVPAGIYPWWLAIGHLGWIWVAAACLASAIVITLIVRQILRPLARRGTLRIVPQLQAALAKARAALAASLAAAKTEAEARHKAIVEKRNADILAAKSEYKQSRRELKSAHQGRLDAAQWEFAARRRELEEKHEPRLEKIESSYPAKIDDVEQQYLRDVEALAKRYVEQLSAIDEQIGLELAGAECKWQALLTRAQLVADEMNEYCDRYFPAWRAACDAENDDLVALRFGGLKLDLAQMGAADAVTERPLSLPAVLAYPDEPSLLIETDDDGRSAAAALLQNVMLRLLTSLPPGKVRFTIIDPVGLGQDFSAFMHLADYDERLVNNRIWTESPHIQKRLTDLTEHMENVIQKYLRNEFLSIQQYNRQAGEVAEPYQILVIAGFPANFSDEAARRLTSVAASGARCGVFTLINVDRRLPLPRGFDLADLETHAATLVWDAAAKAFRWKDDVLGTLPLTLESPPDDEQFTQLVQQAGERAKEASRVEVPFDFVIPERDRWWTADSRGGIEVPLGRAGAKSLQYMRLGKGTSQHVLISGKTGSGKSTLLNALITNLALHYSPDELEFYLIDFKKGVEFKAYATLGLPHARVIAIESEREFGMSVLQRLDEELKRRGDQFRKQGVQDLRSYRNALPGAPMPRVLLVIDEFQEFFTSDDRIAHDASLLLDRLVRQGRAFGIHVMLGSQTLAGAYSLARSTIGQMAVRIALQCSESDAHLILSEDNTAARLLSRPGEAIYNDANGLLEGNHPFQVVWLSDEEREHHLSEISELARQRKIAAPRPIVFEGSTPADPAENPLLATAIATPPTLAATLASRAWLGAAVAVKDPTAISFRRQSGANLLIVGQNEELALGILATAVVGLAAHQQSAVIAQPPTDADPSERSFVVLDGSRPDSPEAGYWQSLVRQLQLDAAVVTPRDAASAINAISDELSRRLAGGEATSKPLFLLIYDLARFRDLRRSEDFGLSFDEDASSKAAKNLVTILRDGPALGIHALVWCDSFNNASRWFDRQTLRNFEHRVLFQMSATDSSNLMDSPAASRLSGTMALYYTEELGQAEKLRPYHKPDSEWLAQVREQIRRRIETPEAGRVPAN